MNTELKTLITEFRSQGGPEGALLTIRGRLTRRGKQESSRQVAILRRIGELTDENPIWVAFHKELE